MSRNPDPYVNRNPPRNPSSAVKRPLPTNNNHSSDHHHPHGSNNNNNNRHPSVNNNGSNSSDRRRSSPPRRSHSSTTKAVTPKRSSRAPPSKYVCTLPKATLDWYVLSRTLITLDTSRLPFSSELNLTQVRSRYSRLHIPSDFYHASYSWHRSIPLDRPLKFITPCSFHIFDKNVPRLLDNNVSVLDPPDADYTWNVRVRLFICRQRRSTVRLGDAHVVAGYSNADLSFVPHPSRSSQDDPDESR